MRVGGLAVFVRWRVTGVVHVFPLRGVTGTLVVRGRVSRTHGRVENVEVREVLVEPLGCPVLSCHRERFAY